MNKSNVRDVIKRSLKYWDNHYDESCGLAMGIPPGLFNQEWLEKYFTVDRSDLLHTYPRSIDYACGMFAVGENLERANRIIEVCTGHMQVTDRDDPGYGKCFTFREEKLFRDKNGTFFNAAPLFVIHTQFDSLLTPSNRQAARECLERAYPVLARNREEARWVYVNPTLADFSICALMSEVFDLPTRQEDVEKFAKYAAFLMEVGVNETLTPSYYNLNIMNLLNCLAVSKNPAVIDVAKMLLKDRFLDQAQFFEDRFPVPFRRGYNGHYLTRRDDLLPMLMGWSEISAPDRKTGDHLAMAALTPIMMEKHPDVFTSKYDGRWPRNLATRVHHGCEAHSHLDRDFSLGSFNHYPPETTIWQTVDFGGSGWQDAVVYLTFENQAQTACVLRLEAIDENGVERLHPYEGDYQQNVSLPLYPHLSFPPKPQVRCAQRDNELLCLFKTDNVDAVLKRFGFNLHFHRFSGQVFDQIGSPIDLTSKTQTQHAGPVIIQIDQVFVVLVPLERVALKGSILPHSQFIEPQFSLAMREGALDCSMYHYDSAEAERFVLNQVTGGFFMRVIPRATLADAVQYVADVRLNDEWSLDKVVPPIDQRGAMRIVSAKTPLSSLRVAWNHGSDDKAMPSTI